MIINAFLRWVETAKAGDRARAASALARAYANASIGNDERHAAEMAMIFLLDDPAPKVRLALAVMLGREGARLPQPQFYRVPSTEKPNTMLPQIALDARFASSPAKVRAALTAFSDKTFRDNFNLK